MNFLADRMLLGFNVYSTTVLQTTYILVISMVGNKILTFSIDEIKENCRVMAHLASVITRAW